jgi:lysophospholipase L1-like esterase
VADRVLAAGDVNATANLTIPIPADAAVVELISRGPLTWVDPRLVRELRIVPHAIALSLLLLGSIALARGHRPGADATTRIIWFRRIALAAGAIFTIVSLETGLRALGERVPQGLAAERHDLGEVREDPRWENTTRYWRRLRARVDEVNEWRHGDIVRMGYIPPDVSDGVLHRFAFQTDEEGFRNTRTRDPIDIAALGDSFTDAMTLDAHDSWTSVLERTTGLTVQNYGTAGFGPQQELRVLTDFVVRHRPRVVVLAYFAGNDLFDAEAFDEFDRSNGAVQRPVPGWQIKDVVSRADTWFVVSALRAAGTWASRYQSAEAKPIETAPPPHAIAAGRTPVFDRGMFTARVRGQTLRWAFMPPYLNTLTMSEHELTSRTGWSLTKRAIVDMQRATREIGAELVVMFLPFKSQIYLPLAAESMPSHDLSRALHFYLRDNPTQPDVAVMMRNRLAQNGMLTRFCADNGIRLLDTTDALSARVGAGENVYFPDESHLNEMGHRIVADTLATFLASQAPLDRARPAQ